jgi:L-fuconolactonase
MTTIDAHQHLWTVETGNYGDYQWLDLAALTPIARTFSEVDLEPQLAAAGVDGTVMVQSANTDADTAAMVAVADRWDRVVGIVGWMPLLEPVQVAEAIEGWSSDPRMVGVRHLIHDEPDPDWIMHPTVLESLALLSEAGLSYDVIGTLPRHLEHAITIAERLPGLRLVIDHLGSPPIRESGWQPWARLMAQLGEHDNVFVKVSGLGTLAHWETWQPADMEPYVDWALQNVGVDRLLYGGDWPVSMLAGGYARMREGTRVLLEGLSESESDRIMGGTAIEVYRLQVDDR